MNKRLSITLITGFFLLIATIGIINFAKGYRPDLKNNQIKPTGLLLSNSLPEGAQVFINNTLKTATDDTLNLDPGKYEVKIEKEGYHSWQKNLLITAELVTETNARLFPSVPELKPLTLNGVKKPRLSPDGTRIFYESSGLFWVLEMSTRPFASPKPKKISQVEIAADYGQYEQEKTIEEKLKLSKFPLELQEIASASAQLTAFSPDETKLLYLAKENVNIPEKLISPVLAASTQSEQRNLKSNILYIYDRKEDKNFRIHESLDNLAWLIDSRHLIFISENKIKAIEYDGQNETIIYAGAFKEDFFAVWPDGSRVVILSNLNPDSPLLPNLYAINLR